MKQMFLILILLVLSSGNSQAGSFSFQTEISNKAEYKIDLEFSFRKIPLDEILPHYFFSNELQTQIDGRIRQFHVKTNNNNLYQQLNKENRFKLNLAANQYGRDVEINYSCTLINTSRDFTLNCDYAGLDDGIPFISIDPIKKSSYTLNCEDLSHLDSTRCIFSTVGKTKDLNYIVFSRTADRLAVSGLSLVVANYYKAFLSLESRELEGYKGFKQDPFYKEYVSPLRAKHFQHMKKDRLLKTSHREAAQR